MRFDKVMVFRIVLVLVLAVSVLAAFAPTTGGGTTALGPPGGGDWVGTPADELGSPTPFDDTTPGGGLATATP